MTRNEQFAKACGWTPCPDPSLPNTWMQPDGSGPYDLPSFDNDLGAAVEAAKNKYRLDIQGPFCDGSWNVWVLPVGVEARKARPLGYGHDMDNPAAALVSAVLAAQEQA